VIPPGTRVAVVAPSGAFDERKLRRGIEIASAQGYDLHLLPDLQQPRRYLAAPDDLRLTRLIEALSDERWGAVWAVRGGYGITRLVDRIPFADLPPRPFIGFSDLTALFVSLHRRTGSPVIHGPMLHSLPGTGPSSREHLFDLLAGRRVRPLRGEAWAEGDTQGWLCGGNLCMLAATCGTPHQLDARRAILVLEEVGEQPYRIDRMLQQLGSAGVFDGVRGFAIGDLSSCPVPPRESWTIRDVVMDHLGPLGVPVAGGLPIGHGAANHAFPWGVDARLQGGTLSWTQARVS